MCRQLVNISFTELTVYLTNFAMVKAPKFKQLRKGEVNNKTPYMTATMSSE